MVVLKNFSQSAYGNTFSLAIEMFKSKPLTGIGINNFEYGCENIKNFKEKLVRVIHIIFIYNGLQRQEF